MKRELAKTYDPKQIEEPIYKRWEENKYFHAEPDSAKKPFTIVMPPPNITGQLHMGHALDNTMQDILIRYKRMRGFNALWQPGTDHASIATEVKVADALRKEEGKEKEDIGREAFLERVWKWREEYGGRIVQQLKKLGSSADWDRERFTMDEGCSKAVTDVFCKLYDKGWIYKGDRIINWCPVCGTSISDAEVEHEEQQGKFWHFFYPVKDSDEKVEIATTRPETMLGDTAVAVNPEDERYKDIVGKTLILPIVNREIPVVADSYVDMEFGTGAVKITPAHDPNDFEVGKRCNLPIINIMNDDATLNENAGKYAGMDRYEARKKIVEEMESLGLLGEIEDHTHAVGTHDRCGTTIEPMVKSQWFVKMDEMIRPAQKAVKEGEIKLIPPRMDKTYFNWTDNIRDWCISRQLWWGHRIPAWYCADCGETVVSRETPHTCPKCGGTHLNQDEDTLDTWFSSALWPFSTLGWPKETEDLKYFYPTDVLVTGYDIIFFWVIRMIFSGYEQTGQRPFHTVLFHGLVRDDKGRKMSKSLGNGIDPLDVIDKYGADALRLTLITGNAPGNDMRFYWERVEANRNFANKVWNASRFILMNLPDEPVSKPSDADLKDADRWIISRINSVTKEVTENMEKYELGIAVSKVYDFIWNEFCDWYIEIVKVRLYKLDPAKGGSEDDIKSAKAALWVLTDTLSRALKLLHPFMPFITEEIYLSLNPDEESIMISDWPVYDASREYSVDEKKLSSVQDVVRGIRNVRSEMDVPNSRKAALIIASSDEDVANAFATGEYDHMLFAKSVEVRNSNAGINDEMVSVVTALAGAYMPTEDLVDIKAEKERLDKKLKNLEKELQRSEKMLSNEKFLSKASPEKVAEEKEKQQKYQSMYNEVKERLALMG